MPLPLIPLALGAARLFPAAIRLVPPVASFCTAAFSRMNAVMNVSFGGIATAAIADQMTNGRSTRGALDAAEAVIGEQGVRRVGGVLRNSIETLGEGLLGMTREVERRYPSEQAPIVPPISRAGLVTSSVRDAVQDGKVALQYEPLVGNSFDRARYAQIPAQKPLTQQVLTPQARDLAPVY